VQGDVGTLVRRINARFGTDFRAEDGDLRHRPKLGWHAMPNPIRDRLKADLEARFDATLAASARLRHLLTRAEGIHARYVDADERAR